MAKTLDLARSTFLEENKSPSRYVGELDNRGSHFYLALYWAQVLAKQVQDMELQTYFLLLAEKLSHNEKFIISELNLLQGQSVDLKGYYHPDISLTKQIMCPSQTLNLILMK